MASFSYRSVDYQLSDDELTQFVNWVMPKLDEDQEAFSVQEIRSWMDDFLAGRSAKAKRRIGRPKGSKNKPKDVLSGAVNKPMEPI